MAIIEAAETTTNLESARWYDFTLDLFDKSDISRPNLVAFTSQESTYDI